MKQQSERKVKGYDLWCVFQFILSTSHAAVPVFTIKNTFWIILRETRHIGCYKNVLFTNTGAKCILVVSAASVEVTDPEYCTVYEKWLCMSYQATSKHLYHRLLNKYTATVSLQQEVS